MSASNFGRPNFQNIFVIPKHTRNSISHEWLSFFQKIHLQFDPCFLLQKLWETKLFPHWTLSMKFIWFCPAAYRSFVHFSSSSCFWTNACVHSKNRQLRLITCLHNPEAMSHRNFTIKLPLENIVILDIVICCYFTPRIRFLIYH